MDDGVDIRRRRVDCRRRRQRLGGRTCLEGTKTGSESREVVVVREKERRGRMSETSRVYIDKLRRRLASKKHVG